MVQPAAVAAASEATNSAEPPCGLPRPRRLRTPGSFHAGEPFPQLSRYNAPLPSASRRRKSSAADDRRPLRRQPTAKYHTFPTPPPAGPSEQQASPGKARAWYMWLSRSKDEPADAEDERDDFGSDPLDGSPTGSDSNRRKKRGESVTNDTPGEETIQNTTPLPWTQLGLLALLSLSEQTALNSIGPYLPAMVASFDEIPDGQEGLYVGLLASAFALAQVTTNLLWGYLSDRVGRKPVLLLGTTLLMVCFAFFGFCTTYAQLMVVHIAMGLLNGNAAVVPTCLGELTDRTNQSSAFTWLPAIYSLGSITGPALGGLLVRDAGGSKYPFLAPNLLDAALLLASVLALAVCLDETLEGVESKTRGTSLEWTKRARGWCASLFGSRPRDVRTSGRRQSTQTRFGAGSGIDSDEDDRQRDVSGDEDDDPEYYQALLGSHSGADEAEDDNTKDTRERYSGFAELANRNTLALLGTYLVFQLANISFNSLYPIFVSSPPPTGRDLGPGTIGLSLSLAGLATIVFQTFLFQRFKARIGNLSTYRYSLLGMAVSMALMPWIGYPDGRPLLGLGTGKAWLYVELGIILVAKSICAVGGLSSVMLLITNSASSNETFGTLNGIAQTLSAAGRSVGPFLSGALFTLSTQVRPKGELLAWGLFAGISLLGWMASFAIRSRGLESAEWADHDCSDADELDDEEAGISR